MVLMDSATDIDARLLAAHATGDTATLSRLYAAAAAVAPDDARWFYLTQAFVLALDAGSPEAAIYENRLVEAGRA